MLAFAGKHILIIVENLPLPFDRRVWQEANTLKHNGAYVSIICPKMKGYTKTFESIDGIDIYRHPLPHEARGATGYLIEYTVALFWEIFLAIKIYRKRKFHVIQGCNPPDLIFIVALLFKLFKVKYVFDHHDINPELYLAKFNRKDILYKLMVLLERLTFKTADFSIATNGSYKEIAIVRGKMNPDAVTIVRSGPSLDRLKIMDGRVEYKRGRKFLVGYVGVIGQQEGLDLLIECVRIIKERRDDIQFAIIGGGTELENIKHLAISTGVDSHIDFYGRIDDEMLLHILNTCDICVNPDRPTEMNNLSTMNKIMEYMALKKPIVQFNLKEGRVSAEQASFYARPNDVEDFAEKIMLLADNPLMREEMGAFGYHRVKNQLSWDIESIKLVEFYKNVLS
ncbi:MAG: glycosyltransferase family 4 protein [Cyclobacteriaceae bacterium]|nr:glycosyltransferase family 4 protein [Cyclobacteriaceae bacterium]